MQILKNSYVRIIYLAFWGLLLISFFLVLYIRFRLLFVYFSDIGGIESNVIYAIQRYLAGFRLYDNPEISPFSVTQYSPIYYLIIGCICKVFYVNIDNPIEVFTVSRAFALLANFVYTFLVYKIGRAYCLNKSNALFVAILAFIFLPPHVYSRPDSLYTVLTLGVLYSFICYVGSAQIKLKRKILAICILLMVTAICTKQSAIILPIMVSSFILFFEKKALKAVMVGLIVAALSMFSLWALMPEPNLERLYLNLILGIKQTVDWNYYYNHVFVHYYKSYALINIIGIISAIWLIKSGEIKSKWLGWFSIIFFLFAALTSFKKGAALNYFTEFVAMTPIMGWLFLRDAKINISKNFKGLSILLICFWLIVSHISNYTWKYAFADSSIFKDEYKEQMEIRNYLEKELKISNTDKVYATCHNYCFLNVILFRNCILPQQDIVEMMFDKNIYDYTKLDSMINRNKIRFIVTQSSETEIKFPSSLTLENYTLKRKFNRFSIYEIRSL